MGRSREATRALAARVQARLAAERARAFAEAARHYQRALELWERVADPGRPAGLDRVELLARAAAAVAFTGAARDAAGLLQDALGRVDPAAEPVRAAVLLARLGTHRRVAGDEAGALAALREAEGLVTGAPPSAEVARVLDTAPTGCCCALGPSRPLHAPRRRSQPPGRSEPGPRRPRRCACSQLAWRVSVAWSGRSTFCWRGAASPRRWRTPRPSRAPT